MRQISRLHRAFASGRLSPVEVCHHYLNRVRALDALNLLITPCPERALQQAEASAKRYRLGQARGPLDGIPFVIKDNFCTADILTTCASKVLYNFVPPYDATVVSRLGNAGCILIGKANMDEFAMGCGSVDSLYGPTKNPWTLYSNLKDSLEDDWYITGGSSGGSAGSVAGGLSVFGIGSDTGGSVRNPASYCGIIGLKPGYGRISRHGLIPLVNALDVPGIMGTSAEDVTLVLSTLVGRDPRDSTSIEVADDDPLIGPDCVAKLADAFRGIRVGIPKEYHAPGLDTETLDAWERTACMLADEAGCEMVQSTLPHTHLSIKCYSVICCADVASNMARYDGLEFGHRAAGVDDSTEALFAATRHEGFNEVVRSRVFAGNFFLLRSNLEKYIERARSVWRLIYNDFVDAFQNVDVLLTPVTLSAARRHSWFIEADSRRRTSDEDVFTQAANLGGVAALSVPVGVTKDGLPLSVQLLAPSRKEHLLLTIAQWLEGQTNFRHTCILDSESVPPHLRLD